MWSVLGPIWGQNENKKKKTMMIRIMTMMLKMMTMMILEKKDNGQNTKQKHKIKNVLMEQRTWNKAALSMEKQHNKKGLEG